MKNTMQNPMMTDFIKRLAKGVAAQFGEDCEVVIHDLSSAEKESTIIAIENGHVTHRAWRRSLAHSSWSSQQRQGTSPTILTTLPKRRMGALSNQHQYIYRTKKERLRGYSVLTTTSRVWAWQRRQSSQLSMLTYLLRNRRKFLRMSTNLTRRAYRRSGERRRQTCGDDEEGGQNSSCAIFEKKRCLQILRVRRQSLQVIQISKFTLYNYIDSEKQIKPNGGLGMDKIKWVKNTMPKTEDKELQIMDLANVKAARKLHSSFPQYSVTPAAPSERAGCVAWTKRHIRQRRIIPFRSQRF